MQIFIYIRLFVFFHMFINSSFNVTTCFTNITRIINFKQIYKLEKISKNRVLNLQQRKNFKKQGVLSLVEKQLLILKEIKIILRSVSLQNCFRFLTAFSELAQDIFQFMEVYKNVFYQVLDKTDHYYYALCSNKSIKNGGKELCFTFCNYDLQCFHGN